MGYFMLAVALVVLLPLTLLVLAGYASYAVLRYLIDKVRYRHTPRRGHTSGVKHS